MLTTVYLNELLQPREHGLTKTGPRHHIHHIVGKYPGSGGKGHYRRKQHRQASPQAVTPTRIFTRAALRAVA